MDSRDILPRIRPSERATYNRCVKWWYWSWRKGLVPRETRFGALELGAWMHSALAAWYGTGRKRNGRLADQFEFYATQAIASAVRDHAPEHLVERADELTALGIQMAIAYEKKYGKDRKWNVIEAEIPLEFEISNHNGLVIAIHKLKPDLAVINDLGEVWLIEHKTAASIRTEHLTIDGQARPYGAMAEPALRKAGLISARHPFRGIIYNFLRKALPDQRPTDPTGLYLNKNGSVSKRQPPAYFYRHPVTLTRKAKVITLRRVQKSTIDITLLALELRTGEVDPSTLSKTPHWSCPKFCPFFTMCVAEENGATPHALKDMERSMYIRRNPYEYEQETTDETATFEMG